MATTGESIPLIGIDMIAEANNLDEAIDLAARVPYARNGTIEIRPLGEVRVPAGA